MTSKCMIDFNKIKMVIWDLDNTFWKGILSEGEIVSISQNVELVKELTDRGIICTVSSKNDNKTAMDKLQELKVADYLVFPHINWDSKGIQIKEILSEASLRAENVLFIDDDIRNLEEALFENEGLITAAPDILEDLCSWISSKEITDKDHSRLKRYKILEKKAAEKRNYISDTDFLTASNIKIAINMENCINDIDRISELIQRTNQLNYTKKRESKEELAEKIESSLYECGSITMQDKYGDYGIVGFFCIDIIEQELVHFLFSCRTMGTGLEQFIYDILENPGISVAEPVAYKLVHGGNVTWISIDNSILQNVIADNSDAAVKIPDNIEKSYVPKILLKGPCDMDSIAPYMTGGDITYEFNFVNEKGFVTTGQNHSVHIVESDFFSGEDIHSICREVPFIIEEDFKTEIFSKKFDAVCYSTLQDYDAGLYRNKKSGYMIAFGGRNFDLTASQNQNDYINGVIPNHGFGFNKDIIEKFAEDWEFLGATSPELYIHNLEYIYRHLQGKPVFVILLGSETDVKNVSRESLGHARHHKMMNEYVREFAKGKDKVRLIELSKYAEEKDISDGNINHLSRKAYYNIAGEIVKNIKEAMIN